MAILWYGRAYLEVSINGGTPIAGWFRIENLTKLGLMGYDIPSGNLT
jgi:hypothetical protein